MLVLAWRRGNVSSWRRGCCHWRRLLSQQRCPQSAPPGVRRKPAAGAAAAAAVVVVGERSVGPPYRRPPPLADQKSCIRAGVVAIRAAHSVKYASDGDISLQEQCKPRSEQLRAAQGGSGDGVSFMYGLLIVTVYVYGPIEPACGLWVLV